MTVIDIAKKLHAEDFRRRFGRKFSGNVPLPSWDKLEQAQQQGFIAMVQAVLAGETKLGGQRIETWAQDIIREEASKQ